MGNIQPGTGKIGNGNYIGHLKYARARYDFAVDAGEVGTLALRGDTVPAGAILVDAFVEVETAFAPTTTTTVALSVESAGDLRAAALTNASPLALSTTGVKRTLVAGDNATLVKTSAAQTIDLVIAAGELTAGKGSVVVAYVELA